MTTITYDHKATGVEIRKALREAFPGVKFSLRMSRGSSYFNASWTDGPTEAQVREVTDYFRSQTWDGMTDSTVSLPDKLVFIEGHEMPVTISYSGSGVLTSRKFSDEAKDRAKAAIREAFPAVDEPRAWAEHLPVPVNGEWLEDYGADIDCLAYRLLARSGAIGANA